MYAVHSDINLWQFVKEKRGEWLFEIRTKSCDSEVLTAVAMKVRPTALWNVTPCSVVECNFLWYSLLYQIPTVMMETGG